VKVIENVDELSAKPRKALDAGKHIEGFYSCGASRIAPSRKVPNFAQLRHGGVATVPGWHTLKLSLVPHILMTAFDPFLLPGTPCDRPLMNGQSVSVEVRSCNHV
jgi:hypothetical protein